MPDSPPQVIHMPLEDLIDPELKFDCPESAGENPTAYVHKPVVDQMAEALNHALFCLSEHGVGVRDKERGEEALAAYREAKNA